MHERREDERGTSLRDKRGRFLCAAVEDGGGWKGCRSMRKKKR